MDRGAKNEINRRYYRRHRYRILTKSRARHSANPHRYSETKRRWRDENIEKVRVLARQGGLKRAGFSVEAYDEFLQKQGGVCAICGLPNGKRKLCADHDHKTGKPRGLLCHGCNTGLGSFRESVSNLEKAKEYLCR